MLIKFLDPAAGAGDGAQGGAGGGAPAAGGDGGRASYPGHSPEPKGGIDIATLIPEEFKERPWVKETKDVPSLFKRVDGLISELGKRPAGIPQESSKPEEWQAFNKAFGVPEKPEEYTFDKLPEGLSSSETFQKGLQQALHKAGISVRQFKLLEPEWNALMLNSMKEAQGQAAASDEEFDKLADSVFGAKKTETLAKVKDFMGKNARPEFLDHVNSLDNKSLIVVAGLLDNIMQKYVSEDMIPSGGGAGGAQSEQAARDERIAIMNSQAYRDPFHPDHDAAVKKLDALYSRIK